MVGVIIYLTDGLPILFWSKRVGLNNTTFYMPKFRTMKNNSPDVATHEINNPGNYLIKFGGFLRKVSIDELPQLFSIIKGDINFIGPRPALHNQKDLIEKRTKLNIHTIKPGITGWAQINGRDNLNINEKVDLDLYYFKKKSFFINLKIIILTIIQLIIPRGIKH